MFEVVERPNEWERQVQAVNDIDGNERLNNLRKFRSNFWQSYIEQHPDDLELRPNHIDSNVYEEAGGVSIWFPRTRGDRPTPMGLASPGTPPPHTRG